MKKILVALFALMATLTASAQGFGGGDFKPEDMAKMQVSHIKEVCKINEEQEKKLTEYFVAQTKKMMENMQKAQENGGGFDMESFQKQRDEQTKFLKSVLTEDQYKLYEEDQKKMMERFQQGGGFGGGF